MTTQTILTQLHLNNIITISEEKLQSNFNNIANWIKKHQSKLNQQTESLRKKEQEILGIIKDNQERKEKDMGKLEEKIQQCFEILSQISQKQIQHGNLLAVHQGQFQKLDKNLSFIGATFEDSKNNYLILEQKLCKLEGDIYKSYEEILKKQDSTEVLKIHRDVQSIKEKLEKNEKDCKHLEHKVENLEIYNQKNQRNLGKKEMEMFKEIQEKIKSEIKNLQKIIPQIGDYQSKFPNFASPISYNPKNPSRNSFVSGVMIQPKSANFYNENSYQQNNQKQTTHSIPEKQFKKQKQPEIINTKSITTEEIRQRKDSICTEPPLQEIQPLKQQTRLSFRIQEEEMVSTSLKNNLQKLAIAKINEKMSAFETKIKSLEEALSIMTENRKKARNSQQEEQIKEKINQIKPELIKLWTKCDTLDDRILFNERRFEEKTKYLSSSIEAQKQNGVGKLDQKFKQFQTEIYANLKELKTKVDGKLNCQDYEKQMMMLEEKLKQMSELIYSKSDKLQVKKALLFLQSKIKEIILVISEDEENQKDALLTKKQLKCMSCDKDVDTVGKMANISGRGNWDALPFKEHSPQLLGKFGMNGFGTLSKKLRKLESTQFPSLKPRKTALQSTILNRVAQSNSIIE